MMLVVGFRFQMEVKGGLGGEEGRWGKGGAKRLRPKGGGVYCRLRLPPSRQSQEVSPECPSLPAVCHHLHPLQTPPPSPEPAPSLTPTSSGGLSHLFSATAIRHGLGARVFTSKESRQPSYSHKKETSLQSNTNKQFPTYQGRLSVCAVVLCVHLVPRSTIIVMTLILALVFGLRSHIRSFFFFAQSCHTLISQAL